MKPWEKYQPSSGKPWEKYRAPEQQQPAPMEEPSFLVGVGKGLNDVGRGLKQAAGFDLDTQDKSIEANIKDKAPVGVFTGNVAAALPTAFIPGANTALGSTLIGAGTGALFNEGDLGERAQQAAIGGAGGFLGTQVPHVLEVARRALAPFGSEATKGRIVGDVIRAATESGDKEKAKLLAETLRKAEPLVPGSLPTAAEVADSGGLAALQRWAEQAMPEDFAFRRKVNADARQAAIQTIAKDESALAAAKSARDEQAGKLYNEVHNSFIQSSPDLERILKTDAGQQAVNNAKKLAANEYRAFGEPVPNMSGLESSIDTAKASATNAAHWSQQPINYDKDNILTAIRKMGGISKELAQETYGNKMWEDGLGNGLFRNNGGQSLDDLAARLAEHGYLPEGSGPYELVEALYKGNADNIFSHSKNNFDDVYQPEITQADDVAGKFDKLISALSRKYDKAASQTSKSPYDVAYYGKDLHNIGRSLGSAAADHNLDPVLRKSIADVYGDYNKVLEDKIPGLLEANSKYKELSRPINQMEIGQDLLKRAQSALSDYGSYTPETPNKFAQALREGDVTAQRVTGFKNAKLADVLDPEQMQTLNNVATSFNRKAFADNEGRLGSNTYQNFSMGALSDAVGVPTLVKAGLSWFPVTRAAMNGMRTSGNWLYSGADKEMREILAQALLNPQKTADLLERSITPTFSDKALTASRYLAPLLLVGAGNTL